MSRQGKAFFFEKKKQKAFICLHLSVCRVFPTGTLEDTKVFWSFFAKKDCLPWASQTQGDLL